MATLAELIVKVGADTTGLVKGLNGIKSQVENVSQSMTKAGASLTKTFSLPLAGIGAIGLKAGMDFEKGMSAIKAVSGSTGEQMAKLEKLAMSVGKEFGYSATESAKGIS